MTLPSPAAFAALVPALRAELLEASAEDFAAFTASPRRRDPAAFARHPWVSERVNVQQAGEILGRPPKTLGTYLVRARNARALGRDSVRLFPERGEDGCWDLGSLAIWEALVPTQAGRQQRGGEHDHLYPAIDALIRRGVTSKRRVSAELGISEELALKLLHLRGAYTNRPSDAEMTRHAGELMRSGQHVREKDMLAAMRARWPQMNEAAGRRAIAHAGAARFRAQEPDTTDGMLYAKGLAEAAGVNLQAVTAAVKAGKLTPVRTDRHGHRSYQVFDPARITLWGGHRTPVDKTWALGQEEGKRRRLLEREMGSRRRRLEKEPRQ